MSTRCAYTELMPKEKKKTPWERPAPARSRHTQRTEPQKREARTRARKAGRHYPNLVDTMTIAKEASGSARTPARKRKSTTATPRKAARRKVARKTSSTARKAAPRKAGSGVRKALRTAQATASTPNPQAHPPATPARRDGSRLRPGVRKRDAQLSREDLRRKGSWAVRFYGRAQLPPLKDARGPAHPLRAQRACARNGRAGAAHRTRGPAPAGALSPRG